MQDYWMIFLKFKNDVRVLFLMLLFKLDLCRYFLNLDGYPLIIYAEKGGYVCLKKNPVIVEIQQVI